ncbi:hypothetical protein AaE_013051 [Aphanomyces astaci]|uniref:Integrase catalytic domain-containing protein n=1 Tax=Aphanomyces astaci TaxID=112090 RepID=A0A6A4Z7D7_APHAT|nr:hypothetical protein AaE_013051 [Aphanomyces astaci]
MVDSLRKLFSNISCPFTLFESIVSRFENNPLTSDPAVLNAQSQKIKNHDGDCLDTFLADVKSIASQYRAAMIPSSLEIAASDYDAFLWANHYMVKLSEVYLDDKQIWDPIRAISSYAKASGQPCSVASIDTAIKDALATRHLRSLALGEHGTADSAHTRSHLINATVVEPASSPVGLVTSRSLPSYAHHKCHNHPGPACFYCGDSAHVLTNCKPLASDYAHGTKRGGFPQDVFDKHGKKNARRLFSRKIRDDHHSRRDDQDRDDYGHGGGHAGAPRRRNPPSKRAATRSRSRGRGGEDRTSNWRDSGYGGRSHQITSTFDDSSTARNDVITPTSDNRGRSRHRDLMGLDKRGRIIGADSAPSERHCDNPSSSSRSPVRTRALSAPNVKVKCPTPPDLSCGSRDLSVDDRPSKRLRRSPPLTTPPCDDDPSARATARPNGGLPIALIAPVTNDDITPRIRIRLYPPQNHWDLPSQPALEHVRSLPTVSRDIPPSLSDAPPATPVRIEFVLPSRGVDSTVAHPPLHVVVDSNKQFALKVVLTQCAPNNGDPDLPPSVVYPPGKFATLAQHWIVDSGATSSCTPHQEYFATYVPCALSLTVGNGSKLPVVGYGSISMENLMSATDTTIPMRSRALCLTFGIHCPQLKFNLLSVGHATDDGYAIAFPSRGLCTITTVLGDVIRASNNAMGLYSFHAIPNGRPAVGKTPPSIEPHENRVLLTQFRALEKRLAEFKTSRVSRKVMDELHMYAYSGVYRYASHLATPAVVPHGSHIKPTHYGPQWSDQSIAITYWCALNGMFAHPPRLTLDPKAFSVSLDCLNSLVSDSRLSNIELTRLWHRCLGHPGIGALDHMIKENPELQVFQTRHLKDFLCETCAYAKSKRSRFNSRIALFRATSFLALVHSDVWGPSFILAASGAAYFVLFVDDFSRFMWVYPLQKRSHLYAAYETFRVAAMSVFKSDIADLRHTQPTDIGTLQSDNAKEYEKLARLITPKYQTRVTFSNAYSPNQNAVAERRIGLVVQKMRAMLIEGSLPKFLWATALEYASWLINITPSSSKSGKSPYFVVFNTHPTLSYIKTFGCTAYVHIQKAAQPTKLDPRAIKAMFIGLPDNHKGYDLMNLHSHARIYSRDVTFWESEFPAINTVDAAADYRKRVASDPNFIPTLEPNAPLPPLHSILDGVSRPNILVMNQPVSHSSHQHTSLVAVSRDVLAATQYISVGQLYREVERDFPLSSPPFDPTHFTLRRHFAQRPSSPPPPLYLQPTITLRSLDSKLCAMDDTIVGDGASSDVLPSTSLSTSIIENIKIPKMCKSKEHTYQNSVLLATTQIGCLSSHFSPDYLDSSMIYSLLAERAVSKSRPDPENWREAMSREDHKKWLAAATDEYNSLLSNGTYELVRRDSKLTILVCRWVFRIKPGGIYKARVVVKGFMQQNGVDYTDIYAPVVRLEVLRFLFALVAIYNLECHQMDVKTAFLNGTMDCDVYMEQPPGSLVEPKSRRDFVCLLKKSLYGLKQAPHLWYWTFVEFMLAQGFTRLHKDRCVFLKTDSDGFTIVSLYVDDLLIIAPTLSLVSSMKQSLSNRFKMTDLNEVSDILGWQVVRNRSSRTLFLHQSRYCATVVDRFDMGDSKPATTPFECTSPLSQSHCASTPQEVAMMAKNPYRCAVGSFMYLAMGTRPDLAYALQQLSQFLHNPGPLHWRQLNAFYVIYADQ